VLAKGRAYYARGKRFFKSLLTSDVYVAFEFQNLVNKEIMSLHFSLACTDANGADVCHATHLSFLELNAETGKTFGLNVMVQLPERDIHAVDVMVEKVVYADGSLWENHVDLPFVPLAKQKPLSSLGKMEKYYRQGIPKEAQYYLAESHGSWWQCGCGQINLDVNAPCITCNTTLPTLLDAASLDGLQNNKNKYLQRRIQEVVTNIRKNARGIIAAVVYIVAASIVALIIIAHFSPLLKG